MSKKEIRKSLIKKLNDIDVIEILVSKEKGKTKSLHFICENDCNGICYLENSERDYLFNRVKGHGTFPIMIEEL